ncbi:uncharacterized protein LOC134209742 [Armigeres subalbatus]|uniref:uncharacterized protein LOC134209742 n=1 Tax=Armigeres subalbatus TaxID=124917 RepID=UPI002ED56A28
MAHRLYNVPMDKPEFEEEENKIYNAAEMNGYDRKFVETILRKHKRKRHRQEITTLEPATEKNRRISLPFYPRITNPIKTALRRQRLQVVHKSENTLRDLLCNLKDRVPSEEQSGVYRISCDDCSAVYIGQTRRKIKVRLREHKSAVETLKIHESSVAAHAVNCGHNINWEDSKLLRAVRKNSQLNESMFITNSKEPLMNEDEPPIVSNLFGLTEKNIP